MPRKPRVQFPGAIYHIVTRGDGRRELFHDEDHYKRLTHGLADEVKRSGWIVLAFCWMPNHIHLLLTTPEPNLSTGMQHWLSGYANWYAQRNRRTGLEPAFAPRLSVIRLSKPRDEHHRPLDVEPSDVTLPAGMERERELSYNRGMVVPLLNRFSRLPLRH